MGIDCGSQIVLCDYPIRLDTYSGCSHGCRYCFAQRKTNIAEIKRDNCVESLKRFIAGKRTGVTNWCDFDIPLHWGGMSDPFQPDEKTHKISLRCLEIFAETGYPVIISTKGKLLAEEPYISLLGKCNAVVQVSMVCPSYDKLELGAPTFTERLAMLKAFEGNCKRVIVRAQPYIPDVLNEVLSNLGKMKESGAYGITLEGMKYVKKKPGTVKVGGDFCYSERTLEPHYKAIRHEAHKVGLAFYCAENRLRKLGDDMACCGCGDVPGFAGNHFNALRLLAGCSSEPTPRMSEPGTG